MHTCELSKYFPQFHFYDDSNPCMGKIEFWIDFQLFKIERSCWVWKFTSNMNAFHHKMASAISGLNIHSWISLRLNVHTSETSCQRYSPVEFYDSESNLSKKAMNSSRKYRIIWVKHHFVIENYGILQYVLFTNISKAIPRTYPICNSYDSFNVFLPFQCMRQSVENVRNSYTS